MSDSEKPTMMTGTFEPLPPPSSEPYEKPTKVAVIGAGVMGQGIAQVLAQAGCSVQLFDTRTNAAIKARVAIGQQFERLAAKGKISVEDARFSAARVRVC
jgi:3-hydroxyacyl-CoA dehydrogenase